MATIAIWRLGVNVGGTEVSLVELAAFLARVGHVVRLYGDIGYASLVAEALGVSVVPREKFYDTRHDVLLWYDSVRSYKGGVPARLQEAMCNIPHRYGVFGGYVESLRCPFIGSAIAKSPGVGRWLKGLGYRDVKVVQFPIDLNYWSRALTETRAVPVVGYVGRLQNKNVAELIVMANKAGGCSVLLGVSDVHATEDPEVLVKRGATLAKFVIPARPLYEKMDVFSMTSLEEGVPRVLMEAMAMSLPVIGWAVGGMANLGASYLYAPHTMDEAVHTLQRLLGSYSMRREVGLANRRMIERYNAYVCEDLTAWLAGLG